MNVPAKLEVRSFTCSRVNKGYPKIGAVPGYGHTLYSAPPSPQKIVYAYHIDYLSMCTRFPRFSIAVLSGGWEPPILGKGRP